MPSMINDVGLWNQTIAPKANYHYKNKPRCEQVSEARAQNVSSCVFIYSVWASGEQALVTRLVLVRRRRPAPSTSVLRSSAGVRKTFLNRFVCAFASASKMSSHTIRRKKKTKLDLWIKHVASQRNTFRAEREKRRSKKETVINVF